MSSPTTPSSGYAATGVTTVVWGTDGLWSTYIVKRITQRTLTENIKLPNGTGITSTRIQLVDGHAWDITVRDDTGMTPPKVGDTLAVIDGGGLIAAVGLSYTGKIVESSWESASKQDADRNITVESLILIESQTGA